MTVDECIKYVEDHLEVRYATKNGAYLSGRTIEPDGCVNHSLGVAQPSADVIFNNMNQAGAEWGVNAILGDFHKGEGKIILALKMNSRPWGCGSGSKGSYNNSRIQWEVCEPAGHTYSGGTMIGYDVKKNQQYFNRMWKMLVAWNVYCLKKFCYPVENICDHSESYKAGYGTNHADMMHWLPKHGKSMDALRAEVKAIINGKEPVKPTKGIQAIDFQPMSEAEVIKIVGPLCTEDEKKNGILACVTLAQFILESGYGRVSEAAKNANNCFGMKASLSNNAWPGSTWDGKNTYTMKTEEWENGHYITIVDTFRKYQCVEDSIGDHSAYLLGAMNGAAHRYEGVNGCKDYKKTIRLIKNGGYATDPTYVDKIVNIIERWNLTKYNYNGEPVPSLEPKPVDPGKGYPDTPFMIKTLVSLPIFTSIESSVRNSENETGIGTFTIVEENNGYGLLKSYKEKRNGWIKISNPQECTILDTVKNEPFKVKVDITALRIRKGPGSNEEFTGIYTGVGIFTIVDVQKGPGSEAGWGLLKSYEKNRDGWISLDYATRLQE